MAERRLNSLATPHKALVLCRSHLHRDFIAPNRSRYFISAQTGRAEISRPSGQRVQGEALGPRTYRCSSVDFQRVAKISRPTSGSASPEVQGHGRTADIERDFSYENLADDVAAAEERLVMQLAALESHIVCWHKSDMSSKSAKLIPAQKPRKVVIAVVGRAKLLDIAGPLQVFADARYDDGDHSYEVVLASEAGGAIATDCGVGIASVRLADVLSSNIDTILVTGGDAQFLPQATATMRACLAKYLKRPRRIGSICVGAFILADLGVLDSCEATTHWQVCDQLQRSYPSIRVKPDALYVTSGRVWTSAGISAGIDMALAMVEDDIGHSAALTVARLLVLYLKRPGGQSQFSVELRRQTRDARGRFDDLHAWIRDNLDADLSVPALAQAAHMSPRNFARVYRHETGESPAHAVEQLRVEAAIRLLESTAESIKRIAHKTGFGDDERMRRAFLKSYGVSPQDYRNRFNRRSS